MPNPKETQPPVAPSTAAEEEASKEETPKKESPPANIQFIGKRPRTDKETGKIKEVKIEAAEVPRWRRDGPDVFRLPDGETQIAGFYHKDAGRLKRAFPHDFKTPTAKGEK